MISSIEYTFQDQAILEQALTHPSLYNEVGHSYERLEFLGDRCLSLALGAFLFETFPDDDEGKLSKRFAYLSSAKVLAEIAKKIGLSDILKMTPSELREGHNKNTNVLCDALESILGAIYLDGGYEAVNNTIRNLWRDLIEEEGETPYVDYKSLLQEWSQRKIQKLPLYTLVAEEGPDHRKNFEVQVLLPLREGEDMMSRGKGPSKKLAEQEAAKGLYKRVCNL